MMSFRRKAAIYILSALTILALAVGLVFAAGCSSSSEGESKWKDGGDAVTTSVDNHSSYASSFSGSKTITSNDSEYWYLSGDCSGTITIESGMPEICLHGCKFTGNIVVKDGAGLILIDCSSDHSGTITGGTGYTVGSYTYGGGIYVGKNSTLVMQTGNVCNCSARIGGAIYAGSGATLMMGDDIYIYSNTTTSGTSSNYSYAGAVVCDGCSAVEMFNMSVYDNVGTASNTAYGGAGIVFNDCDNVSLHDGVSIYGNTSGGFYGGAGIYLYHSTATIEDCKIYQNTVTAGYGGGVMVLGGTATFSNCEIYSNTASSSGGAVYVGSSGSSATFEDCSIYYNSASANGGGVTMESGCTVELNGSTTVKGNSAQLGGGVCVAGTLKISSSGVSVTENTASVEGGGVYLYNSSGTATLTMSAGTISSNHVADGGSGAGISASTGGSITISGGSVSGNVLDGAGYGAGIYLSSDATAKLSGGSVSSNEASEKYTFGGGVAVVGSAALTISGGTISDNYCYWNGGGLYIGDTGTVTMSSGSITGNSVAVSSARGGGIDMDGSAVFNMSGGSMTRNDNPKGYGGAVCMIDSTNCTFNMSGGSITDNTAMHWGGVYSKGTVNLSGKIIITDNCDKYSSGVMYTNTNCDTPADLLVFSGGTINLVGEIKSGSSIGVVFSRSGPDVTKITSSESSTTYYQSAASYFFLDTDDLRLAGYLIYADSTNKCVSLKEPDPNSEAYVDLSGAVTYYDTLAEALAAAEGSSSSKAGTVYLCNDVTLTSRYDVNGYVTLDLNGFSLTCTASRAFYVYGNFTLKDSTGVYADISSGTEGAVKNTTTDSDGKTHTTYTVTYSTNSSTGTTEGTKSYHTYTAGAIYGITANATIYYGDAVFVSPGGTFNMYGGIIADNKMNGGAVGTGGNSNDSNIAHFNMYGGCISGNDATYTGSFGTVYVGSYSEVHIYAGVISSNTTVSVGGGVSAYMTTGTLYFGETSSLAEAPYAVISGNSADSYGGGVYVRRGTMYVCGGEISGNVSSDGGAGIYDSDEGTLIISGGKIVGNNTLSASYYYGGGVYVLGALTLSGDAVIRWNTYSPSSSSSDDKSNLVIYRYSYGVYIDGDFAGYIGIGCSTTSNSQLTSKRDGGSAYTNDWLKAHIFSDRTECLAVVDGNYIWQYSSHDFTSSDSIAITYDEGSKTYVLTSACSHCGADGNDYVASNLEIRYKIEDGIGYAYVETSGGTISVELTHGFLVTNSSGSTTWYSDFSDAEDAVRNNSNATITLYEDITDTTYNIIYDVTVDLNGHYARYFSALANVVIKDSSADKSGSVGTIRTGSGCSIILYGGTYGNDIVNTSFDITVAEGYVVVVTSDGRYMVTEGGSSVQTDSMTASVTANGTTFYFESFDAALLYAESLSGDVTITLLKDVSADIEISSTNEANITIDLGEHTLSGTVTVADGETLTISGSGNVDAKITSSGSLKIADTGSGIEVDLGSGSSVSSLEVASGSVDIDLAGCTIESLSISSTSASVTVDDSSTTNSGTISTINSANVSSSTLTVKGGTYAESQVGQIYGCVPSGYAIYCDGTGYQVIEERALSSAAVSVTYKSGSQEITIYFDSIEDAVKYANALTGAENIAINLLEDIDDCTIDISASDISINLNGKSLSGSVTVKSGSTLTVTGEGELDATVSVDTNGKLIISASESGSGIEVTLESGSSVSDMEITSGTVDVDLRGNTIDSLTVGDNNSSTTSTVTISDSSSANNGTITAIIENSNSTLTFEGGKYTKAQVDETVYENLASGFAIYCDGSDFYVVDESAAKDSAQVSLKYTTSGGKEVEIYFGNLESAISYAESLAEAGVEVEITLLEDIESSTGIDITTSNITIDLNNHTLGGKIEVAEDASVTFYGDGEIDLGSGSSVQGEIVIASGNITVDLGGNDIGSLVVGDSNPDSDPADVTIVDSSDGSGSIGSIEVKDDTNDNLTIEGGSYSDGQVEQVYENLGDDYAIKYDSDANDGDVAYKVVTKDKAQEGAVAYVTVEQEDGTSSTVYFDSIEDAVEYAQYNSGEGTEVTITLLDDVTDGMAITDGTIEVDLNGHNISELTIGDEDDTDTTAKVTITDSSEGRSGSVGSLETSNMGEEESLTIEGGTFSDDISSYIDNQNYEIIYGTDESGEFDSWHVVEKSEREDEAAASVTIGEDPGAVTYYFETFEDAFAYASKMLASEGVSSVSITLYDDIDVYDEDSAFEITTGTLTIDLNGHTLKAYILIEADETNEDPEPGSTTPGAGGSLYVKDSSDDKSGSIEGTIKVVGTSASDSEQEEGTDVSSGTYANTVIFEDVTPNKNLTFDFSELSSSASETLKYAFGSITVEDGEGKAYYGIIFNHEHLFDIEVWERQGDGSYTLRFMCSCGVFEYKCTCTEDDECTCEKDDDDADECTCDESCDCTEYVVYGSDDGVTVSYEYNSDTGEVTITMTVTFEEGDSHYNDYSESEYKASNTITMTPLVSVTVGEEGQEIFFDDLAEALAYAQEIASDESVTGDVTVKLYDDIETLEIDNGTIEVDLNGHTISELVVGDAESFESTTAKVTVTDSSEGNSGSIENITVNKSNGSGEENTLEISGGSYSYGNMDDVAANLASDYAILYDSDTDSYKVVEESSITSAEVSVSYTNENEEEVTIYFESIEDAISYAETLEEEVTITLQQDIDSCDIEIDSSNITIDLNGKSLEGNISIDDGAVLTVEGSGEIDATIDIAESGKLIIDAGSEDASGNSGIEITLEEGSSMNGKTEIASGDVSIDLGGNTLGGEVDIESGASLTITGSGSVDAVLDVEGENETEEKEAGKLIIAADSKNETTGEGGIEITLGDGSSFEGEMDITSGDVTVDLAGNEISSLVIGDDDSDTTANVTITDSKDSEGNSGTIDDITVKQASGQSDESQNSLEIQGGSYTEEQIEQIYENLSDDYAIKYAPDENDEGEGSYEVVTKDEAQDGAVASVTVKTDDGESTVYFDSIEDAVEYAQNNSGEGTDVTITLQDDVESMAITDGTIEVDLNGHSIEELTIGDSTGIEPDTTTADVTITDSSEGNSGTVSEFVFADESETSTDSLTIEGGTYTEDQIDDISEYLDSDEYALMYDPDGGESGEGAYTVVDRDTAEEKSEVSLIYTNEDGETVEIFFENIEDAIDYATGLVDEATGEGPDVTIKLETDVENADIEITTDNITIDLDGNKLSGDISIANDSELTVTGSGEIDAVFDVAGETEEGADDAGKLIIAADSKSGDEGGIEITLGDGSSFEGEMDITSGTVDVDLAGNEIDTLIVGDGVDTNGTADVTIEDSSDEGSGSVDSFEVVQGGGDSATIQGGNFSDDISDYIDEDSSEVVRGTDENGDETYHAVDKDDIEEIAAASVTTDAGTYYFETFEDALAFANSNGGTIKLFDDVEPGDIEVSGNVTLDLNGKTLTADIAVTGSLVITDTSKDGVESTDISDCEGTVVGSISGSDITIQAGTYTENVAEYVDSEGDTNLYLLIGVDDDGNLTYKVVTDAEIENAAAVIEDENGNERYYSSASAAFKDASDGDTITLQADVELDEGEALVLSANGNVTLDLNGKTVNGDIAVGEGSQSVILTIVDSSFKAETEGDETAVTLGTGAVTGEISANNYSSAVLAGGTYSFDPRDEGHEDITLEDGYVVVVSTDEDEQTIYIVVEEEYAQYAAVASVTVETADGEETFYFGSIEEAVKYAEEAAASGANESVTITLVQDVESMEIVSGNITVDLNGHTIESLTVGNDDAESDGIYAHVTITDSQNSGTISEITVNNCEGSENSLAIEGGVYSEDEKEAIGQYVDEDEFVFVKETSEDVSSEGSYILVSLDDIESVAAASVTVDGETYYFESFEEALEYVLENGGTLTMYADEDIYADDATSITKDVTVDLNGHTLNANIEVDAGEGGSLAVTDSADGGEITGRISVKDDSGSGTEDYSSSLTFDGGVTPSESERLDIDLSGLGTDDTTDENLYVFSETGTGSDGKTEYGIVEAEKHECHYNIAVWTRDGEKIILKVMCACGDYYEITVYDEETGGYVLVDSFTADAADVTYSENADGSVTVSTTITVTIDGEDLTFSYSETFEPVVSVTATVDGRRTTVYFDDLESALEYAAENSGSVTLLADIDEDMEIVSGNVSIDLNGHEISGSITVAAGASLAITDSEGGGYVAGNVTVDEDGTLALMGGTYAANIFGSEDIQSYVASGYVDVVRGDGSYYVTNASNAEVISEASVTTDAGTVYFESFEAAIAYAESLAATSDDVTITLYKDIEDDIQFSSGSYTLDLNGNQIIGSIVARAEGSGDNVSLTIADSDESNTGAVIGSLSVAGSGDSEITLEGGTYTENILEAEGVKIGEGFYVLVESEEDASGNKTYTYFVTDEETAEDMAAASVTYTDASGEGRTVYFENIDDAMDFAKDAAADDESVQITLWDDVDEIEFTSGDYELDLNGHSVDELVVGDDDESTSANVTITDSSEDNSGYVGSLEVEQADEQVEGSENSVTIEGGSYGGDILSDENIEIGEGAYAFVGEGDDEGNRTYTVTDEGTAEDMATASVTYTDEIGEERTVYFEDIEDAIEYAEKMSSVSEDSVTVTLLDDVEEIEIADGNIELDLNGHSVDELVIGDEDEDTTAKVTITDSSPDNSGYVDEITVNQADGQSSEDGNELSIEGGTFGQNVEDYIDDDHAMIFGTDGDGDPTFAVAGLDEIEDMAAAKVTDEEGDDVYFASLEDAVEYAAESGGKVTLLEDGELSIRISDELSSTEDFVEIEIDLNGYTLDANITLDAATGSLEITDSSDDGSGNGTGKVEGTISVITTSEVTEDDDFSDTLVFEGTSPNADLEIDLSGLGMTETAQGSGEYENTYVFEDFGDGTYGISDAANHEHSYTIEVWTRDGEKVTLRLMCACGDFFEDETGASIFEAEVSYDATSLESDGTVEITATATVDGTEYSYTETIKAVASVTTTDASGNETTIYFDDLQDAIDYAQSTGETVTLLDDVDADIVTTGDVTIDLNGHTLSGSLDVESGIATIVDSSTDGTITLDCDITVESDAELVIGDGEGSSAFDISGSITVEDGGTVEINGSGEISAELEIEGTLEIEAGEEGVEISGNIILSDGEIDVDGKLSITEEIIATEGTTNYIGGENAELEIAGPITVEEDAKLTVEGSGEISSTLDVEDGGTLEIIGDGQGLTLEIVEDTVLDGTLTFEGNVTLELNGNDLDADLEIADNSDITLDGQGGTIKLEGDLETTGTSITVASDAEINLNGNEMSLETEEGEYGITVEEGTLSVSDSARGGTLETDILVETGAEIELRDDVIDGYASGHGDSDDYTVIFEDENNLLASAADEFGNVYYETVTEDEHALTKCNYDFMEIVSFDASTCILTVQFWCLCGETWTDEFHIDETGYTAAATAECDKVIVDIDTKITVLNSLSGVSYTYTVEYEMSIEMYTEGQKDEESYEDDCYYYEYNEASCYETGSHVYIYKDANDARTGVRITVEIPKTHKAEARTTGYTISGKTYTVTYYVCEYCEAILFTLDGGYTGDEDGVFETDDILNYESEQALLEDLENYAEYEETKDEILASIEESMTGHMGSMGFVSEAYDKILENLDDSTYEWQTGSSDERSEYMEQMMAELEELQEEAEFQMDVAVAQGLLEGDLQDFYDELLASGNYEEGSYEREQLEEILAEAIDGIGNLNIPSGSTQEEIDEITRQYYAKIIEFIYKIRLYRLTSGDEYVKGEISSDSGFNGDSSLVIKETATFDLDSLLGFEGFTYVSMETGETMTDEQIEALFDGMSVLAGYSVSLVGSGDVEITSYNGVYTIKILLPEDLNYVGELTVVYIGNNGTIEVYEATIDDGYIIFETTHFSNYYIIGEKTGDYGSAITFLGIVLIIELILAGILLGLYFGKKGKTTGAKALWIVLYALVAAAGIAFAISIMAVAASLAAVVIFSILVAAMLVADIMLLYLALEAYSEETDEDEAALAQESAR